MPPKEGDLHPAVIIPGRAALEHVGLEHRAGVGPSLPSGGWLDVPSASSAHGLCHVPTACGHMNDAGHSLRIPHRLQRQQPLPRPLTRLAVPSCSHVQGLVSTQRPGRRLGAPFPGARATSSLFSSSYTASPSCPDYQSWEPICSLTGRFKPST